MISFIIENRIQISLGSYIIKFHYMWCWKKNPCKCQNQSANKKIQGVYRVSKCLFEFDTKGNTSEKLSHTNTVELPSNRKHEQLLFRSLGHHVFKQTVRFHKYSKDCYITAAVLSKQNNSFFFTPTEFSEMSAGGGVCLCVSERGETDMFPLVALCRMKASDLVQTPWYFRFIPTATSLSSSQCFQRA